MSQPKQNKLNALIDEAEILADLLIEKANAIKEFCQKARLNTAGVSTPAKHLHLERLAMEALAKRRKRLNRRLQ